MTTDSGLFRLMRGDRVVKAHPTVDDVTQLIEEVSTDTVSGGPPDLCIEYHSTSPRVESPQVILVMMLTFQDDSAPLWLVLVKRLIPPSRYRVLSKGRVSPSDYVRRSCCGLDSLYRRDTLIDDPILLRKVIAHFLRNHEPWPQSTWIDHDEAVRDS
jgi:hypothetical protein